MEAPAAEPAYCSWMGISCCTTAEVSSGNCTHQGTVRGIRLEVMQVNSSIEDPLWLGAVQQLHSCGLQELNMDGCDMNGHLTEVWGTLTNLRVLRLSNNWLSGTLPTSLTNLTRLRQLGLGTNFLAGTIPPSLARLQQLEVLNLGANGGGGFGGSLPPELGRLPALQQLNLESNSLTGTIPEGLCGPGSSLRVLNLRNNQLRGPARQLSACTGLTQLDISNNQLSGLLPASRAWNNLVAYRVRGNGFVGGLPEELYHLPVLGYLDASNNKLDGVIARSITLMTYLNLLNLEHNRLQGSIPNDVWYLPQLSRVDLSHNNLTGGISNAIQLCYGLSYLDLSHNPLAGAIPAEMAGLSYLQQVDVSNTSLSCGGPIYGQLVASSAAGKEFARVTAAQLEELAANPRSCPAEQLLPCFLHFMDYYVPREGYANMACRPIRRKSPEAVRRDCGANLTDGILATTADALQLQSWTLDAAYYQYRNCRCLDGYEPSASSNATYLSCVPSKENRAWVMSAVQGAVAVAVVLVAGLCAWQIMRLYFKPRWLREKEMHAKRKRPPPSSGDISMVVTDIEGYSDLIRSAPQLMTRALGLHNAVIRRVVLQHAGHVVEQEGDSFTCVFHEPRDAVAFCLQSQLALFKLDWPRGLTQAPAGGGGGEGEHTVATTVESLISTSSDSIHRTGWGSYIRARLAGRHSSTATTQGSTQGVAGAVGRTSSYTSGPGPSGLSFCSLPSASSDSGTLGRALDQGVGAGGSGALGGGPEEGAPSFTSSHTSVGRQHSLGSRLAERFLHHSHSSPALPPIASSSKSRLSSGRSHLRTSSRVFSMLFRGHGHHEADELFKGLRVRMGVASGYVPPGQDLSSSSVKDLAEEVSNLAHGGQVLVESSTFTAIHGLLGELGAVDAHGYNDKLVSAKQRAAFKAQLGACGRWLHRRVSPATSEQTKAARSSGNRALAETDAVALDMGTYLIPGLSTSPTTDAPPAGGRPSRPDSAAGVAGAGKRLANALQGALGGLSGGSSEEEGKGAAREVQYGVGSTNGGTLHVYSISSPALVERARRWGSALAFDKPGTRQVAKSYFDAPGTLMSSLDLSSSDVDALPAVTLVFVIVEGAKAFARRKRADAAEVHRLISGALRDTLMHFVDGYLCREQEGDFKYMVAFGSPSSALEWCLLMQEVALYLPWEPQVLGAPGWKEVRGPGGELLFRGPRLKMGLCEGVPRAILPDHAGHADYHGQSINAAARFCAVAAHGGQVVLEEALAAKVLASVWLPCSGQATSATSDEEGRVSSTSEGRHSSDSAPGERDVPPAPQAPSDQQPTGDASAAAAAVVPEGTLVPPTLVTSHPLLLEGGSGAPPLATTAAAAAEVEGRSSSATTTTRSLSLPATNRLPSYTSSRKEGPPARQQQQQQPQGVAGGGSKRHHPTRRHNSDLDQAEASRLLMGTPGAAKAGPGRPRDVVDVRTPPAPRRPMLITFTRLGTYAFKGTGEVRLVAAAGNALGGRRFPAEPPGGKGQLLSPPQPEQLVMEETEVPLQDLVTPARVALEQAQALEAARIQRLLGQGDPLVSPRASSFDSPAASPTRAAAPRRALLKHSSMPARPSASAEVGGLGNSRAAGAGGGAGGLSGPARRSVTISDDHPVVLELGTARGPAAPGSPSKSCTRHQQQLGSCAAAAAAAAVAAAAAADSFASGSHTSINISPLVTAEGELGFQGGAAGSPPRLWAADAAAAAARGRCGSWAEEVGEEDPGAVPSVVRLGSGSTLGAFSCTHPLRLLGLPEAGGAEQPGRTASQDDAV